MTGQNFQVSVEYNGRSMLSGAPLANFEDLTVAVAWACGYRSAARDFRSGTDLLWDVVIKFISDDPDEPSRTVADVKHDRTIIWYGPEKFLATGITPPDRIGKDWERKPWKSKWFNKE